MTKLDHFRFSREPFVYTSEQTYTVLALALRTRSNGVCFYCCLLDLSIDSLKQFNISDYVEGFLTSHINF